VSKITNILAAATFAAEKHKDQKRKGSDGQPYINHPLEVAKLVAEVGGIDDEDMLVAAILHDTVEDCGVSFQELEERFGATVAGYVRELTDDKSLPKAERKRLQVEHAPHLSHGAKQIKLADKISNITDVLNNPPENWSIERRREYVEWGERVVAGLRGANKDLEKRFDAVVETARAKLI
jgi:guanosine-3',5'-bis(diphosphate) 3'-pyrophosphohydrolase